MLGQCIHFDKVGVFFLGKTLKTVLVLFMILFCQVWKSVEDNQVSCESGKHGLSIRLDVDPAGSIQLNDKVTLVGKDPKELEMSKLCFKDSFSEIVVDRSIQLFQHQLADKTFGGQKIALFPGLREVARDLSRHISKRN